MFVGCIISIALKGQARPIIPRVFVGYPGIEITRRFFRQRFIDILARKLADNKE